MRHRLGAAAGAAVILLVVTACTSGTGTGPSTASDPVPDIASAPVTTTSSADSSPVSTNAVAPSSTDATSANVAPASSLPTTTRTSTPTEIAEAQVKAFVPTYFAAEDRIQSSLTVPLSDFDRYAVNPLNDLEQKAFAQYRAHGWVSVGNTKVGTVRVTSIDLTASPPTAKVTTCVDVRDVKGIDKATGKDVTVRGRPDFFTENLTVVNIDRLSAASWRVSWKTNKGAASCAGS